MYVQYIPPQVMRPHHVTLSGFLGPVDVYISTIAGIYMFHIRLSEGTF